MKQVTYCVISRDGAWSIRFNEKTFGPCSSKGQAINVAVAAATKALPLKCSARVLVEDGEKLDIVWSNGRFAKLATA
jgi:hypothetical protein